MTMSRAFRRGAIALILSGFAPLVGLCRAEPASDADLAALQADVKKAFKDQVTPFVRN